MEKSMVPAPLKVNEEVSSSAWVGNKKTKLQVRPESDAGMSKLKMVETVDETAPS